MSQSVLSASTLSSTRSGWGSPADDLESAFVDFLASHGHIDSYGRSRLLSARASTDQTLTNIILELGLFEEGALFDALAEFVSLERIEADDLPQDINEFENFDVDYLKRAELWPVFVSDEELGLATSNPLDLVQARALSYVHGRRLRIFVANPSALRARLNTLDVIGGNESAPQGTTQETLVVEGDAERLRDIASDAPIVRLLSKIVSQAVERHASDIHIEPFDDRTRIRIRVDGVLQTQSEIERGLHLGLVSRIKVLSKLNIAEQRLPQDGRIRLAVRGKDVDFRVATSPSVAGESVVLRILDRSDVALDLAALGFPAEAAVQLKQMLQYPNGIILVTGPTGSGKSTTLYAALEYLNTPHVKIFTVEDPVEYQIKGINQIAVRPQIGLDFAHVLRSVLRQDPDIIMIGEIRDVETAKIAVQAALTGHLVLSTLHTNSAAAAITRMRNLGIEDYLLASSLRGVLAQRLVRKSCTQCHGATCSACGSTGYKGRTVVHELLPVNSKISDVVASGASDATLFDLARLDGMQSLTDAGRKLVSQGVTTSDELLRVLAAL
jgi:general secretion pathway protein E